MNSKDTNSKRIVRELLVRWDNLTHTQQLRGITGLIVAILNESGERGIENQPPSFYNFKEVQAMLGVSRPTLYRWANEGRIPAVKVATQWRFPVKEIHSFMGIDDE